MSISVTLSFKHSYRKGGPELTLVALNKHCVTQNVKAIIIQQVFLPIFNETINLFT